MVVGAIVLISIAAMRQRLSCLGRLAILFAIATPLLVWWSLIAAHPKPKGSAETHGLYEYEFDVHGIMGGQSDLQVADVLTILAGRLEVIVVVTAVATLMCRAFSRWGLARA